MKKPFLHKFKGTFTERYVDLPSKLDILGWALMLIGFFWVLLWGFAFLCQFVDWLKGAI